MPDLSDQIEQLDQELVILDEVISGMTLRLENHEEPNAGYAASLQMGRVRKVHRHLMDSIEAMNKAVKAA